MSSRTDADALHAQIMNLPCDAAQANKEWNDRRSAYQAGHRDARHAAAELACASAPAWVPVSERLPEDGARYPVATPGGHLIYAAYDSASHTWTSADGEETEYEARGTYYAPLPEPPRA